MSVVTQGCPAEFLSLSSACVYLVCGALRPATPIIANPIGPPVQRGSVRMLPANSGSGSAQVFWVWVVVRVASGTEIARVAGDAVRVRLREIGGHQRVDLGRLRGGNGGVVPAERVLAAAPAQDDGSAQTTLRRKRAGRDLRVLDRIERGVAAGHRRRSSWYLNRPGQGDGVGGKTAARHAATDLRRRLAGWGMISPLGCITVARAGAAPKTSKAATENPPSPLRTSR